MKQHFVFFVLLLASQQVISQSTTQNYLPLIHLTDSVICTEIKDQSNSPTCWAFGTNSLFESDIFKKNGVKLNLSEMFIARYSYIDKLNKWLATKGKTYYAGGGQFHDVLRVIIKQGMMPEKAYSGLKKGEYSHNHARLDTAMKKIGKQMLKQDKIFLNTSDTKKINDTLDRYLGKLPVTFWYNLKQYTPKTFAKEILFATEDYIEVMSFADLPLNKKCLLTDKFNWAGDSLYNISLTDMQILIDTALKRGWSVAWEGDVTQPGFNFFSGYAKLDDSSHQFDVERIENYKTEKTVRDHMLHIVGSGSDEKNNKWYYLKNSWGTWFSKYKGFLFMDENYFKMNTVMIMVNKNALPVILKNKLGLKTNLD